jgi:CRISPR/Cas system-associated protein Csm6
MKRIYYLYDAGNQPIVTVGIFKDEKGFSFARTLSIYGEGESNPLNKEQARNIVDSRFENAAEILDRRSYTNEIYPRRVENLYYRLISIKNKNRCVNDLFRTAQKPFLKIDLNAVPTDFEKYLLKIDVNPVDSKN